MVVNILLISFSALFTSLSFAPYSFFFLAWFSLSFFLYILIKTDSFWRNFFYGLLWGFIFFGLSLSWISGLTFPGYIALLLYLSLYPATFGSILSRFKGLKSNVIYSLFIPSLWVILEYIYGNLFTGFPWLFLGISQANNLPFLQIASLGGVYLLSWILTFFNTVLAQFFAVVTSKTFKNFLLVAVVVVLIAHLYGFYKLRRPLPPGNNQLRIALIQGNIPSLQRWKEEMEEKNLFSYLKLTRLALKERPALVIWPETAVQACFPKDKSYEKIASLAKEKRIFLLTGGLEKRSGKVYNSALLFSPKGNLQNYRKVHLVPFGEFIPGGKFRPWKRLVIKLAGFDPSLNRGKNRSPLFVNGYPFGVAICYEDIFPEEVNIYFKRGAKFLTVITNDSWFGEKGSKQHLAISILRAAENGSYLIRCANTGVSCLVSPQGRILKEKGLFTSGYLIIPFPLFSISTFYRSFPSFFPALFITILVTGMFRFYGFLHKRRSDV